MNKIFRFYELIKFTNFERRFYYLLFLSFLSIFAEMLGFIMVIPLTLTFLNNETGIGIKFIDHIVLEISKNSLGIDPLVLIVALISILFIAKLLLLAFSSYKIFSFAQKIGESIANQTFIFELNKPYLAQYKQDSSQKIRRTLYDTLQLSSSLSGLIMMISEVIFFILIIFLFLTINMKLFYPVLIIFIIAILYSKFSKNFILNASKAQQEKYSSWLKFLQISFGGIKMIKLNNSENFFSSIHKDQTSKYFNEEKKLGFIYIFPKIFFEFLLLISFVLVIVATKFILEIPNETIIPILALFTITAVRLVPSVYKIILNYQKIIQAQPYIASVYDVFKNKNIHNKNIILNNEFKFSDEIKIENLNFSFEENIIFKNLDLRIKKNEIVGIYGPSGSGKTTLIDLISGLINPISGKVLVDQKNIENFKPNWQKKIGYVYQETFIIDGNLKDNIIFSKNTTIDNDYLNKITELLKIKDIIKSSGAGERGSKISGGQKQRIGIARALVYKPELLILDEFTSSLDVKSENEILDIIKNLNSRIETTIIMISHRKNPFKVCDKVYEIKNFSLVSSTI